MTAELSSDIRFEIGHVLFIDIVGYSKLSINEQSEQVQELKKIAIGAEQARLAEAEGKLIRLPTGDGMALVFRNSPEAPAQCALEISKALKTHTEIKVRMGVHSGPVNEVVDVNERTNIAGAGMNIAQRVMDCGDAGHILLSKRVAEDLEPYRRWQPCIHELGECEVKHGVKLQLFNFYSDEFGNPAMPEKMRSAAVSLEGSRARPADRRKLVVVAGAVMLVVLFAVGWRFFPHRPAAKSMIATDVSTPEKSIAVLPLENLSDEKENAFFADGLQDDILTSLAKIGDLKVISRTSVSQYRGAGGNRNLRDIARELGIESVLEGSVRRVGNRILVNVKLIDAHNDRQVWAERYDRTVADSIGLQGELAAQIAAALKATLAPEEKARLEAKPTDNPEAYDIYLRALGRQGSVNVSKEDLVAAEKLYGQAIALDPKFALAHARLSIVNSRLGFEPSMDQEAILAKARVAADEALRLSPSLGEAHMARGLCLYWDKKDYPAALKEFSLTVLTAPNEPEVHHLIAGIYRRQGRWRESLASYQRAQELDPRNLRIACMKAVDHMLLRDWSAATASYNRALEIAPDSVDALIGLAYLEIFRNANPAAAKAILQKIPAEVDPDGVVREARWDLSMLERDFDTAEKMVSDFPGDEFLHVGGWPKSFFQGRIALARGNIELAQRLLATAAPDLENVAKNSPNFAEVHARLGLLYAEMGQKNDALLQSRRAMELEPESQNAFHGTLVSANLALVCARTGDADQAIALIERLLSTPGPVQWPEWPNSMTLADLRLRWEWDPLRNDPRFKKIVAGPEPKTIY